MRPRKNQGGFTLLETTIWLVVGVTLTGFVASAVTETVDVTSMGQQNADLQDTGRAALSRIAMDLNRAGHHEIVGVALPHVFSNGTADERLGSDWTHDVEALSAHVQALATMTPPTIWEQGTNPEPFVAPGNHDEPLGLREIVFALPEDRDGDGRILSAETSAIEWSDHLVGYLLVPGREGTFDLIRREERAGGDPVDVRVCRWVQSMTFDTSATKPVLPRNAVEVHLRLTRPTQDGHWQSIHHYTTVVMRNVR